MDGMLLEKTTKRSSSLPEYTNTRLFSVNSKRLSEMASILRGYEDARSTVLASISSCSDPRERMDSSSGL